MAKVTHMTDWLTNLVANLGTPRDKAYHTTYEPSYLTDEALINAYRYAWLPRKIVDIPAVDATRQWRRWLVDDPSEIEDREQALQVQRRTAEAAKKARLFGGSVIYLGTNDNNLAQPLRGEIRYLTVLTPRQVSSAQIENRPQAQDYGKPVAYDINGERVHPSRVCVFQGADLPDNDVAQVRDQAFGDSILAATMEAIKQADGTAANIASLVYEAQIDVVKIPGLMAGMTDPAYEAQVLERLTLAAKAKSINGMLVLDAEEEYDQKSASFGDLTNVLMAFMQVVSGASNIPMTRLLGHSPGGMSATGESDARNYYDYLRSIQEAGIGPALENLDRIIAPGSDYEWRSLWQNSPSEQAKVWASTAETLLKLSQSAAVPEDDLSEAAVALLREQDFLPAEEDEEVEAVESPESALGGGE